MPLSDTKSFTNHCGVADFKGHSYFFYHTGKLPGGGGFGRSVAVEEFQYNADGSFPTIMPTDEGVKPIATFNPYRRVEAETMAFSHGVKTEQNDRRWASTSATSITATISSCRTWPSTTAYRARSRPAWPADCVADK